MTTDHPIAQIRIATPADAYALAVMHVTSWRETYQGLLPDNMLASLSVESRAVAWTKIMGEPATERSTVIYLAEYSAAIVGFCSCGAQRTETLKRKGFDGEVSAVYVLREFQKRMIGTQLLTTTSSDLIRRGFKGAALWVLRDNLTARRFYEHLEGEVIGEREDVREGKVLIELAYGWPDLKRLNRLTEQD